SLAVLGATRDKFILLSIFKNLHVSTPHPHAAGWLYGVPPRRPGPGQSPRRNGPEVTVRLLPEQLAVLPGHRSDLAVERHDSGRPTSADTRRRPPSVHPRARGTPSCPSCSKPGPSSARPRRGIGAARERRPRGGCSHCVSR